MGKNWRTPRPIPCSWQQLVPTQELLMPSICLLHENLQGSLGFSSSPHCCSPLMAEPHLGPWMLVQALWPSRWTFGQLWLSQVVSWPPGGTQAMPVSNSHCRGLLSELAGSSMLLFCGFYPPGELLYSRRTQVLRGKCRGEILQAAARHGLLKLIGGRSSMEEFHGFWSILK